MIFHKEAFGTLSFHYPLFCSACVYHCSCILELFILRWNWKQHADHWWCPSGPSAFTELTLFCTWRKCWLSALIVSAFPYKVASRRNRTVKKSNRLPDLFKERQHTVSFWQIGRLPCVCFGSKAGLACLRNVTKIIVNNEILSISSSNWMMICTFF